MKTLYVLLLLLTQTATAQTRIAVVDTGLDLTDPRFSKVLCKTGHTDFTGTGIQDDNGHGTHIAGLVAQYAKGSKFCLVIYKYYIDKDPIGSHNTDREVLAFNKAIVDGDKYINFSGGGEEYSAPEFKVIKEHPEVTFVVAAGNDGVDLTSPSNNFYPASYHLTNVISVGNMTEEAVPSKNSNYAPWLVWEIGVKVLSTIPGGMGTMTGTSMATAIRTGKMVKYESR